MGDLSLFFNQSLIYLLCILTSEQVLHTTFAGWNHLFLPICTHLCIIWFNIQINKLCFFPFSASLHEKGWKSIFWPVFGVRSTQTLVEIFNNTVSLVLTVFHDLVNVSSCHVPHCLLQTKAISFHSIITRSNALLKCQYQLS